MADEVPHPMDHILKVILKKRKNNEECTVRRKNLVEQKVKKLKFDNFLLCYHISSFGNAEHLKSLLQILVDIHFDLPIHVSHNLST